MTNWGFYTIIILWAAWNAYSEDKRTKDLRHHIDKRFDDLQRSLDLSKGVR